MPIGLIRLITTQKVLKTWSVKGMKQHYLGSNMCDSPFMGKHFRCRVYIGGYRSFEVVIVKKANMWL